jgi:hypothetical protein
MDVFPRMLGALSCFVCDAEVHDIGTPERLAAFRKRFEGA